jgi:hypothetical protein
VGRRADLGFDWNEIITNWYCTSLQIVPEVGWEALGTIERLYPQAIDETLRSGGNTFAMVRLIDVGSVLALTEHLEGFSSVFSRMRSGEHAAMSELAVAAGFVRLGYRPTLEPEVLGRRPDCSITVEQDAEVLFEVVTPESAEVMRGIQEGLTETVRRGLDIVPGTCVNIVFVTDPSTAAREIVLDTVFRSGFPTQGERVLEIPNVAHIRVCQFKQETMAPDPVALGQVMLGAVALRINPKESGTRVNAKVAFTDERADRFLEDEAKHFPGDTCNVVVMDLSGVPTTMKDWRLLLERRFQPKVNRHFSAAILFRALPEAKGIVREWAVVPNPYARRPLPDSLFLRLAELS